MQRFTKRCATIEQGAKTSVLLAFSFNEFWDWFTHLPGMNQAFLFSLFLSTAMTLVPLFYFAKRRPTGTKLSWGEAVIAATYAFGVMFVSFGIVPHQWLQHADKDLEWTRAKLLFGPWDIVKPQAYGGWFPMTLQYEAIRDIIVVLIHVYYFGLLIFCWIYWQNRGKRAAAASASTAVATSTFGRPLVRRT